MGVGSGRGVACRRGEDVGWRDGTVGRSAICAAELDIQGGGAYHQSGDWRSIGLGRENGLDYRTGSRLQEFGSGGQCWRVEWGGGGQGLRGSEGLGGRDRERRGQDCSALRRGVVGNNVVRLRVVREWVGFWLKDGGPRRGRDG